MKNKILTLIAFLPLASCTKLVEKVYDRYDATAFYESPAGSDAALAKVYSQIPGNWGGVGYSGADRGWYDLNTFCGDEQVIPHRNTGDWELDFARLYKHDWSAQTPFINNTWNWLYRSIFDANLSVELLTKVNAEASKVSEAKVLRAFFYYLLLDDFGSVPFYTENTVTVDKIPQKSRKEVFDFVVKEIKDNIDNLSTTRGGAYYSRINKWAAYTILAKLYLNAAVYTGTAMWQECLNTCNKLDGAGFSLHSGALDASHPVGSKYFELFGDVCPEDETIWAIYIKLDIVGRNIYTIRSLIAANSQALFQLNGWNGCVILQDFYNKYSDKDVRRKQFLVGPQPGGVSYNPEITNLDNPGADRNAGVRQVKFYSVAPMNGGGASNDIPIYRYADVLLMKAECNVRLGRANEAKPFIDQVRVRAGLPALAAAPTLTDIYDERGFELNIEGHRRQDMIRFNTFLLPNKFRGQSPEYKKLFPIPTSAINKNTTLKQNPGY